MGSSEALSHELVADAVALAGALLALALCCAAAGLYYQLRPTSYAALENFGGKSCISIAHNAYSKNSFGLVIGWLVVAILLTAAAEIHPYPPYTDTLQKVAIPLISVTVLSIFLRSLLGPLLRTLRACFASKQGYEVTIRYEYMLNTDPSMFVKTCFSRCLGLRVFPDVTLFGDAGQVGKTRRLWSIATWWGGELVGKDAAELFSTPRTGLKSNPGSLYDEHPELQVSSAIYQVKFTIAEGDQPTQELLWVDVSVPKFSQSVLYVHSLQVSKLGGAAGGKPKAWSFPAYYKLGVNQFAVRVFEGTASLPQRDSARVRDARAQALQQAQTEWRWQLYKRETGFANEAWGPQQNAAFPSACWFGRTATNKVPLLGFSGEQQGSIPLNEFFGGAKSVNFYSAGAQGAVALFASGLASKVQLKETWSSPEEVPNTWRLTPLTSPQPWTSDDPAQAWQADAEFAAQLLQGVYPDSMRLVLSVPAALKLYLGKASLKLPGGASVAQLIRSKALFLSDVSHVAEYALLAQAPAVGARVVTFKLPAATGLGFAGILLNWIEDGGARKERWYSPGEDTAEDWLLAKTYARFALSNVHEAVVHALNCHLRTEPYAVAFRRCLSTRHPLYKLLYPHLRYTILINFLARQELISPGGVFDLVSSLGGSKQGFIKMMADEYVKTSPLDQSVPRKLRKLGLMAEQCALKAGEYPYRDYALPLWNKINDLVTETLHAYYEKDADMTADTELQSFLAELQTDGFPQGNFVKADFQTRAQLVELVTTIIWVVSGRHAAVNFLQYNQMAYGPNSPLWAAKLPPPKGQLRSASDVLRYSTTREASVGQAAVVWILSQYGSEKLNLWPGGDGPRYQELWVDGPGLLATERFQNAMRMLQADGEQKLRSTRRGTSMEYQVLLPVQVPNSIAI